MTDRITQSGASVDCGYRSKLLPLESLINVVTLVGGSVAWGLLPPLARRHWKTDYDNRFTVGGESGASSVDASRHCDPVRIGRRGLVWLDDDDDPVVDDSEKLSLAQRSTDFRRTTRRGGEEGAQVVLVHRNCCEESVAAPAGDAECFDRHESHMVFDLSNLVMCPR